MPVDGKGVLAAEDLERVAVPVPEWKGKGGCDGTIYVRMMTGDERDTWEEQNWEGEGENVTIVKKHVLARLVRWTACDAAGNLLWGDDDVPALNRKSGAVIRRLYKAAVALNRIGEKEIGKLEGNS